ncbi:Germin [Macleaya cordata]|uniref:Germin-like protein n=1 Tax=Macleaya cordata TaxID=56857 RepID=A0A200QHN6_MACCD|nr:Germin [Macleaya cordata]
MASSFLKDVMICLLLGLVTSPIVQASDPDIIVDFIIPPNTNAVDGSTFTFTGIRTLLDTEPPANFKVTKVSMAEFPALNGQSVSLAVLQFPASGTNPPHTHPRSAELLFVVQGSLEVGFVDTTNKLYTQTLQLGDMFVFPKGLVHYQYNSNTTEPATAFSAFGSANAGTVSVPEAVFTTGIDDGILAKSFKTDVATIQKIKAGLAPKPKA